MKRLVLALLVTLIAFHAPWRLMALGVETVLMSPAHTRTSDGDDKYWKALDLELKLISLGWEVSYQPRLSLNGQEVYGLTDPGPRIVLIDARLHWNARLAVLAHEAGHIMSPMGLTREQGEVFAESVGALVSHDGLREHARYLADVKAEVLVMAIFWRDIYRAAAVLEH